MEKRNASDCRRYYHLYKDETKSLHLLFFQAHWASKQHFQKALQEALVALVDVQLVGQQREAMVLQELLLLLLQGSAEVRIQQLGRRARICQEVKIPYDFLFSL